MNPATRKTCIPDDLLDQQRQRWMSGETPSIDSLLIGTPFTHAREVQLDLIYHEIVIREELNQPVSVEEYRERFPHLKSELDLHFEIHQALRDHELADTNNANLDESWPESLPAGEASPESIGDYVIERELGRGGMAVVYLARHRTLRRRVAIKTLHPQRTLTPRELIRIRTEAEAIARLSHPNLVQIYEIGEHHGTPWIALEFADQGTLAQRLQTATYSPEAAAELIEKLARALEHAHARQIVHRDVKPANILLTDSGEPKISDFGLAKVLDDAELSPVDVTRTGETIGTPRYMAPEQAQGLREQIGPATDIYALGTLLYECLTGRPPFVSTSVVDTLRMISSDEPIPPRRIQATIPRDLETICLHCLEKLPSRRYPTAQSLAGDLQRFRQHEPITARRPPTWERVWKWCLRRPALATLILLSFLLISGGLSAAIVAQRMETQRIHHLRIRVSQLTQAGRQRIEAEEYELAQDRLQEAWQIVQSEPALFDHETSVAGWLDHARTAINKYHWSSRVPPREFDEQRDSAILESALVVPHLDRPIPLVRDSIQHAVTLTPPDAAWDPAREQLSLLDLAMIALEAGPEAALAELDQGTITHRFDHEFKADLLRQLGRTEDAAQEDMIAAKLPPQNSESTMYSGLSKLRRKNYSEAEQQFQQVLEREPEHFLARLLQGVCCLKTERLSEARIALTAAIAQRPRFHWSFLFRSQVHRKSGDLNSAQRDLEAALQCRPIVPESYAALVELASLSLEQQDLQRSRTLLEQAVQLLPHEPAATSLLKSLEGRTP